MLTLNDSQENKLIQIVENTSFWEVQEIDTSWDHNNPGYTTSNIRFKYVFRLFYFDHYVNDVKVSSELGKKLYNIFYKKYKERQKELKKREQERLDEKDLENFNKLIALIEGG